MEGEQLTNGWVYQADGAQLTIATITVLPRGRRKTTLAFSGLTKRMMSQDLTLVSFPTFPNPHRCLRK